MGFCRFCGFCAGAVAVVPVAAVLAALFEQPTVTPFAWEKVSSEASEVSSPRIAGDKDGPDPVAFGSGKMFDKIAFAYDLGNRWMSLGLDQFWRQTLINECLDLLPGDKVLDLATGTADVALLVGARLKELGVAGTVASVGNGAAASTAVVGVDPSREMLRRGVQKVLDVGLEDVIHLHQGDAQNLSTVESVMTEPPVLGALRGIDSASVDKVTMSFGIRNVPDRDLALREMGRVLRKAASSRVCILEFSLPDGSSSLSKVAQVFIQQVVPLIGKIATFGRGGAEYRYLEQSIVEFPAPQDFAAQMTRNGLPVQNITAFAFGSVQLYTAMVRVP